MPVKAPNLRHLGAQETRERILAASRAVFREKGFDRASMRDIIQRAGLSGAGVAYHHFKSKESIVQNILEEQVARDYEALSEKLGKDDNFIRFLNMTGSDLKRWLESAQCDIFLDLWPQIFRNEAFWPFMERCRDKFDTRFRNALCKCVTEGLFVADLDIENTIQTLVMLGHGLKMRFSFHKQEFDFEATAAAMRRLYRALLQPTAAYPFQN